MNETLTKGCWVCGHEGSRQVKTGSRLQPSADDFRITDASYGATADIFQCTACGFLYCPHLHNPLDHYASMEDREYEATRQQRALQFAKLLARIPAVAAGKRLLDIGAGSGILIEEAIKLGCDTIGVEPSTYLADAAKQRGLPVITGSFPNAAIEGPFDVITLIDVIEHVDNPLEILDSARRLLAPDGVCVLVTPDLGSLAARILGWHWWHFRVAHIGYFNERTLALLLGNCGLVSIASWRPGWFFPADYLATRAIGYLPKPLRFSPPAWLGKLVVPLNLHDSLLHICKAMPGARIP